MPADPRERLGLPLVPTTAAHGPLSRTLRLVVAMSGLTLMLVPYFILCVLLMPWRPRRLRLGNWVGATAGRWIHWLVGIRYEVVGESLEAQAPALYVQNHAGTVDFWLAMQLCPAPGSGTVKREILWVPIVGVAYWLSGHLLLNRSNRDQSIAAMDEISALVHEHRISVWILPEGTRSRDGRLLRFRKGFAHMALATRLPIIPVVVHQAHRFWARGLRVHPGRIIVEALPAIPTEDWTREHLDEHIEQVRQVFIDHLGPDQRPLASADS